MLVVYIQPPAKDKKAKNDPRQQLWYSAVVIFGFKLAVKLYQRNKSANVIRSHGSPDGISGFVAADIPDRSPLGNILIRVMRKKHI